MMNGPPRFRRDLVLTARTPAFLVYPQHPYQPPTRLLILHPRGQPFFIVRLPRRVVGVSISAHLHVSVDRHRAGADEVDRFGFAASAHHRAGEYPRTAFDRWEVL